MQYINTILVSSCISNRLKLKEKIEQEYNGLTDTVVMSHDVRSHDLMLLQNVELNQLDVLKKALCDKLISKLSTKVSINFMHITSYCIYI